VLSRRRIRRALSNNTLQKALERASAQHNSKYKAVTEADPDWEATRERCRAIRQSNLDRLPELIVRFREEAERAGAKTHLASTPEQALAAVEEICRTRGAKLIVKSKSMVSEEIGLNHFLEDKGYTVVETDLGEWIVQLAGERPSHITAPALHKTKEEVAALLSKRLGRPVPADIGEMVKIAREELRQDFCRADIGISGANLAVAESGTLVLVSNEGNARLVTGLPPVHVALVTVEKFVESLEQAITLIKGLVASSSGMKLTSYVSFITGPSRTTDIEKQLVLGVHGPRELHIIILDNGRLAAAQDKALRETLFCLKCGGCMLVCPVFQAVGGHLFGGPVYPGGIGGLLTAVTRSVDEGILPADLCADCKKCETFCPVGIPTGDLLVKLKNRRGPALWEKALSSIFKNRGRTEFGARILSLFERLGRPTRLLGYLPLPWTKGKRLPGPDFRPELVAPSGRGPKVYFFQGCLVKFFLPDIRRSVREGLEALGFAVVVPTDQACCGAPGLHLGCIEDVKELAARNLDSFERERPDFILTVCPTGNAMLKKTYPELDPRASAWTDKIFDFTRFIADKGLLPDPEKARQRGRAFYHTPCHSVNELGMTDEPLRLLRRLGFEPAVEADPTACCGFCGVFSARNPEVSERLWEKKAARIKAHGAALIATDCPGCVFQIRSHLSAKKGPRVVHSAELWSRAIRERSRPRPSTPASTRTTAR